MAANGSRVLLLDYDGTLVPFADRPELASPDAPLVALLSTLAAVAANSVHIVSGRPRETLERWLGALPIGLHAEHGLWSRSGPGTPWTSLPAARDWMPRVHALMDEFAARAPGAWTEEKTASLAWHYRQADAAVSAPVVAELRALLAAAAGDFEVLDGARIIETRARGVHKGVVVPGILKGAPQGSAVLAVGDDRTDEDLFAALPPGSLSYKVGAGPTCANHRLDDVEAVRALLRALSAPQSSRPGGPA